MVGEQRDDDDDGNDDDENNNPNMENRGQFLGRRGNAF